MNTYETEKPKKQLSPAQALNRIRKYCAYQERSQHEVRQKLYEWGLRKIELESIIAGLVSDGYLKEERFAKAFTGGKFRHKKWGRSKIRKALQIKKVSEPLIKEALSEIDEKEYIKTLKSILTRKDSAMREKDSYKRKYKLAAFAIQKGFEPELVWNVIGNTDE